jgi:hypothetical protein
MFRGGLRELGVNTDKNKYHLKISTTSSFGELAIH